MKDDEMKVVNVAVTDGRYLINYPDAIMIKLGDNDPFYVTQEIWAEFTGGAKINSRFQSFKITAELYKSLKMKALVNPQKTNNTISSDFCSDVCEKCGGLGYIDAYKHINGGICFECNGKGK